MDTINKAIKYSAEHPEIFKQLSMAVDNGCMKLNYNIEQIPQTFIYDKSGKLVIANPDLSDVQSIIDSLLLIR